MLENGNKNAFICPLKVFVNIALEWAGVKGMNCFNNYDKDCLVVDDFKSSANFLIGTLNCSKFTPLAQYNL